jgi:hypothetical protein
MKDKKVYLIEEEMTKIRKECREKEIPYTTDTRYMALVQQRNKFKKEEKQKEVRLAKVRDLWLQYCANTKSKPSKEEFFKMICSKI